MLFILFYWPSNFGDFAHWDIYETQHKYQKYVNTKPRNPKHITQWALILTWCQFRITEKGFFETGRNYVCRNHYYLEYSHILWVNLILFLCKYDMLWLFRCLFFRPRIWSSCTTNLNINSPAGLWMSVIKLLNLTTKLILCWRCS